MDEETRLVDPSSFGGALALEPYGHIDPQRFAKRPALGPRAFGQQMPLKSRENTKRKKRAMEKASRKRNRG